MACLNDDKRWYLAGVTSFGFKECGSPRNIGIYTNATIYHKWILKTITVYSHSKC